MRVTVANACALCAPIPHSSPPASLRCAPSRWSATLSRLLHHPHALSSATLRHGRLACRCARHQELSSGTFRFPHPSDPAGVARGVERPPPMETQQRRSSPKHSPAPVTRSAPPTPTCRESLLRTPVARSPSPPPRPDTHWPACRSRSIGPAEVRRSR